MCIHKYIHTASSNHILVIAIGEPSNISAAEINSHVDRRQYLVTYCQAHESNTVWKVPKYRAFSAPYFPVFSPNTGIYGPEKNQYLDTSHAV